MCVETLTGVLFWSSDLLGKPFRAACFPFETLSGSLLLLAKTLTDLLAFCEFSFGPVIIIITDPPGPGVETAWGRVVLQNVST